MIRVLIGIGIVLGGFMIVWKSEWILRNFGRVDWAEEHLAIQGGSRLFYKLIGLAFILLGFFVISGIWYDLLNAFASLIGLQRQ
jgi:hypothetical protein